MSDPTTDDAAVSVEDGGIRVSKSFSNDEFPVPAVVFEIASDREDPARLRIVDDIPESFPMDRVGFHPDYESEDWTAYNDHRVEFERVFEPGETLTTVYGIRDDDPDTDAFLGVPTVETAREGEEMDDVLGADGAEVVRDVLGGERSSLPGMDEPEQEPDTGGAAEDTGGTGASQDAVAAAADPAEAADPLDGLDAPDPDESAEPAESAESAESAEPVDPVVTGADEEPDGTEPTDSVAPDIGVDELQPAEPQTDEPESPDPRPVPDEAIAAVTPHDTRIEKPQAGESGGAEADDAASEPDADDATDGRSDATGDESGGTDEDDGSDAAPVTETGGVAAALAAEIRSGEVDEEDLDVLQEELDLGTPNSVDVRLSRVQSRLGDLAAYVEALQTFIDEEGTADGVLAEIQTEIDDLDDAVGDLSVRAERADSEREGLADDVADVEEFVESVRDEVSALADDLETTDDRVGAVEDHAETIDDELGDVWDDIAEVDARLVEVEKTVEDTVGDSEVSLEELEGEIARIDEELAELEEFRERLSDAFGA
ncbi:hypothetical protein GCM10027435_26760 [Haloparvum alkalitolerans]|uniref:hypothetical protein n=1 Tax=Haloparvum alkalitolerans TaxID=1042953 RepID=UPI003CE6CFAB